jgi:hypothetical protein
MIYGASHDAKLCSVANANAVSQLFRQHFKLDCHSTRNAKEITVIIEATAHPRTVWCCNH